MSLRPFAALDNVVGLVLPAASLQGAKRRAGATVGPPGARREFALRVGMCDEQEVDESTSERLRKAPQHSDVDSMLRGRPRVILLDGGIPPATPLPTNNRGPEALRHCLATVLPRELAYWAREPAAHRPIQTPTRRSLYKRAYGVKIILAAQMRRRAEITPQAVVVYRSLPCGIVQ